jgi:hypothetical protein
VAPHDWPPARPGQRVNQGRARLLTHFIFDTVGQASSGGGAEGAHGGDKRGPDLHFVQAEGLAGAGAIVAQQQVQPQGQALVER